MPGRRVEMSLLTELKRRNDYKVAVAVAETARRSAGWQSIWNCCLRSLYAYCVMHDA